MKSERENLPLEQVLCTVCKIQDLPSDCITAQLNYPIVNLMVYTRHSPTHKVKYVFLEALLLSTQSKNNV
mgnify:FL=1